MWDERTCKEKNIGLEKKKKGLFTIMFWASFFSRRFFYFSFFLLVNLISEEDS